MQVFTHFEVAHLNLAVGARPEVELDPRPDGGRIIEGEVDL
jgi:starvation-inducible outer membrane lipoprotein